MSDNEDLLDDDLGDQSLADYNLGNEEEDQLLADDYDNSNSQNVPSSIVANYSEGNDMVSNEYQTHSVQYGSQVPPYQVSDTECVVPNIVVEQTPSLPEHPTYAPYSEPPVYDSEHRVPPAIPAMQVESPQIVPSEMNAPVPNGDPSGIRERFISERPVGAQRAPQIRDIPDSLDKVVIPRGMGGGRGRGGWRGQHFAHRYPHPYRRNNMHRNNFTHRASFYPLQIRQNVQQNRPLPEMRPPLQEMRPPPQEMRSPPREMRPTQVIRQPLQEIRPPHQEMRPLPQEVRPPPQEMRPPPQEMRPPPHEMRPLSQEMHTPPQEIRPLPQDMRSPRQDMRPLPQDMRSSHQDMRPPHQEIRPPLQEMRPPPQEIRPPHQEMRPLPQEMRPDIRPEMRPEIQSDLPMPPMGPNIPPDRPVLPTDVPNIHFRPQIENRPSFENRPPFERPPFGPNFPRFHQQFRPNIEEPRPNFGPNVRPNFETRPVFPFQRSPFNQRPFGPPIREIVPNNINHMPQVTIRQTLPGMPLPGGPKVEEFGGPKMEEFGPKVEVNREQEVRMLPVQLPPNLPPGGLSGKKVLINPHFKGNFQPPADGPIKDIDDAAERFIAEQRNALARAAARKLPRPSPQRYIENTTIEIENELAQGVAVRRRSEDDDLLRRQEEFINANRAGLRRRMRSPSPPPGRRSASPPSPRRSPERRARPEPSRAQDEETEYRRQLRHQERLRERVLRAKEVRRRKNAVALHNQITERERERDKERQEPLKLEESKPLETEKDRDIKPTSTEQDNKPDTTRKSPEKVEKNETVEKIERDRSPVKKIEDNAEINSTCENLTPPRETMPTTITKPESPGNLTPPLPEPKLKEERRYSDDDSDLILDDIDSFLSDDDDTGRFKEKSNKLEPAKPAAPPVDLRSKLPPKSATCGTEAKRPPRQKIVFDANRDDKKKKDKSPIRRTMVSSSTKADEENVKKPVKIRQETEVSTTKLRQRIIFDNKEKEREKDETSTKPFSNRRVVLQRKVSQSSTTTKEASVFSRIKIKTDPTKPNPGIFSRAFRTAIGGEKTRIVVNKTHEEPQIEYESDSDIDEDKLLNEEIGNIALVINLPHGMTDTRLKTLAGNNVQSLVLDKEERSAKITFKTTIAADSFKKKFNNKMVAASRLTVTLQ